MVSFDSSTKRLDLRPLQGLAAGDAHSFVVEAFALSDQGECQVRQRSQIAASPNAALRWNKGRHAPIQHFAERVDDKCPHAGMTLGERISPQQHHGARLGLGKRCSHSHRMRSHKVHLQFADLLAGNANVTEFAYPGCNRVSNSIAGDNFVDHRAGQIDGLAGIRGKESGPAFGGDFADLLQRQIVPVNVQCVQGSLFLCRELLFNRGAENVQILVWQCRHFHFRIGNNVRGLAFSQQHACLCSH